MVLVEKHTKCCLFFFVLNICTFCHAHVMHTQHTYMPHACTHTHTHTHSDGFGGVAIHRVSQPKAQSYAVRSDPLPRSTREGQGSLDISQNSWSVFCTSTCNIITYSGLYQCIVKTEKQSCAGLVDSGNKVKLLCKGEILVYNNPPSL